MEYRTLIVRRAALRMMLCAVSLFVCARAAASAQTSELREKDVRRAEKVLEKLLQLNEAAAGEDGAELRSVARKLYPGLFAAVAEMQPSDLKTDIDTAVYLYEAAARGRAGESEVDCEGERPDVYRPLCLGLEEGTTRRLLAAKARLHTRWAEAVVKSYRGATDAETARLVSEMKAARANELDLAARVALELRSLEGAEHLERDDATKVSADKLSAEFDDALARAGALLYWMPRSPVYYQLSAAWRGYKDGLFWYQKVQSSKSMVVSAANGFQSDPLRDLRLDAQQVGHTAAANWRTAAKYTRLAEQGLRPAVAATPDKK